jgi:hypothetical protein
MMQQQWSLTASAAVGYCRAVVLGRQTAIMAEKLPYLHTFHIAVYNLHISSNSSPQADASAMQFRQESFPKQHAALVRESHN